MVLISFQVRTICQDFGIVCIRREGKDIEKIISTDEILQENKVLKLTKLVDGLSILKYIRSTLSSAPKYMFKLDVFRIISSRWMKLYQTRSAQQE